MSTEVTAVCQGPAGWVIPHCWPWHRILRAHECEQRGFILPSWFMCVCGTSQMKQLRHMWPPAFEHQGQFSAVRYPGLGFYQLSHTKQGWQEKGPETSWGKSGDSHRMWGWHGLVKVPQISLGISPRFALCKKTPSNTGTLLVCSAGEMCQGRC